MDYAKIEEVVLAIINAAPAIEKGIVSAAPYVQAIIGLIKSGGAPSDNQWAELKARLDAGSAVLQNAANEEDL